MVKRVLLAVEIVGVGLDYRSSRFLPSVRQRFGSRRIAGQRLPRWRRSTSRSSAWRVEDVELDRVVAAADRIGQAVGAWRHLIACRRHKADRCVPAISRPPYCDSRIALRTLPPARSTSAARAALRPVAAASDSFAERCIKIVGRQAAASRTIWQRERIVGSRLPGAVDDQQEHGARGGSSRFFSKALAALGFMSSAGSTMTTR